MAEQEGGRDLDRSLVLSIFRGENFVVKGGISSNKVFLRAKCPDLQPEPVLESGAVRLSPGNSEPEFNSQLAWSLSRKQLKDLRSNRSIIRVACVMVDDRNGTETEIGYVVLHVKDATCFDIGDVDPSKAKTHVLLGTKDPWRSYHPKLQMILQLEDRSKEKRPREVPKNIHQELAFESSKPEYDVNETLKNAAVLSETKPIRQEPTTTEKFCWTVNEKDGYFQLGIPADKDDLYILNTTVISASYLHLLWDGRSPRKRSIDNYFWQIKYTAYGCEISSEPFLLAKDDESRRTFIGDKATARIRTNGVLFYDYLQDSALEFRIIRYLVGSNGELCNEEVMGLCFASLTDLTDPGKGEYRVALDVVSEWGTPRVISAHEKPEIRVIFTLDTVPNYFSFCTPQLNGSGDAAPTSDINSANHSYNEYSKNMLHEDEVDRRIHQNSERNSQTNEKKRQEGEDAKSRVSPSEDVINQSNVRRLLKFEDELRKDDDNKGSPSSSSATSTPPRKPAASQKVVIDKPKQKQSNGASHTVSESEESDFTSNKEDMAKFLPQPGDYKVEIQLTRFWLKSKKQIRDTFMLSYIHPPVGISDSRIDCFGEPLSPEFTDSRQGFVIMDGELSKNIRITRFSEGLLNEPLTVEFRRVSDDRSSHCFASSMIPFGRIFSEKDHYNVRTLEDAVDILKLSDNVKIGTLFFKIVLNQVETQSHLSTEKVRKQSAFFPPDSGATVTENNVRNSRNSEKADKVSEELRDWRKTQEEMYKMEKEKKEAAYLKLLSEEAAKRDAERESVMEKKYADLEKRDKELKRERKALEERVDKIKALEAEVKDNARQLALDQEALQQNMNLRQRRLEEDHKIEINSFTRQIHAYKEDHEKLKTKLVLLEKKLETKEAEIDNLVAMKREQPDSRMTERVKLLEQENKTLKNQLREANTKKEQYKKQSFALCQKLSRLQEERDQELKDQNDNLRLQILASKEHKELKKERKAVQGLSDTLKALKCDSNATQISNGPNGHPNLPSTSIETARAAISKEDQIQRLADERTKLLGTGAYTQFDMVIKELENRIVTLARQ
ncbi:hypothetical protein Ocin01_16315 [Orchesella cincta]|uniref:Uncharacterized protein n=1 Tax=Orchesella cincta TaxID=48709 RepID=A0A1D2MBJ9_ORCCI|nr:hypothetical protein Ocin01_16315 [Orchesella cincta]